jgi:hypothetical protein
MILIGMKQFCCRWVPLKGFYSFVKGFFVFGLFFMFAFFWRIKVAGSLCESHSDWAVPYHWLLGLSSCFDGLMNIICPLHSVAVCHSAVSGLWVWLWLCFFPALVEDGAQSLVHARQVLYQWATPSAPILHFECQ